MFRIMYIIYLINKSYVFQFETRNLLFRLTSAIGTFHVIPSVDGFLTSQLYGLFDLLCLRLPNLSDLSHCCLTSIYTCTHYMDTYIHTHCIPY